MTKLISKCPSCDGALKVSALKCACCGLELKNDFGLSVFDQLNREQYDLLISFLKNRGNLKEVQSDMKISYPTLKKKMDELLGALNLTDASRKDEQKEIDTSNLEVDPSSSRASNIIKAKLKEHGGHVTVYTLTGLPCQVYAGEDGKTFMSDKLPISPAYQYDVFDVIVDLLLKQGGHARKGNGRNYKLGETGCEENTVVGAIAKSRGYNIGDSVFDPVFVMAAILEWAGIVVNGRGELTLTSEYRKMI